MITPRLKDGDKVAVIAPSSPFLRSWLKKGVKEFEKFGFNIFIPDEIFARKGYLAGDADLRAKTVEKMFADKSVKGIICARGGFGSTHLFSHLDFKLIKENPKVFIGFSDLTPLLNYFAFKLGFVTFHGPMLASSFSKKLTKNANNSFIKAVTASYPLKIRAKSIKTIVKGKAEGKLAGGNLSLIAAAIGTPYETSFDDKILFIEEVGEPAYKIDRMLTQLKDSGRLKKVKGIIFGDMCKNRLRINELVNNFALSLNIPAISSFPAGHILNNTTLPIGAKAVLNADERYLEFSEASHREVKTSPSPPY